MLYFEDPGLKYHHTKARCLSYQNSENKSSKLFEEIKLDVEDLKTDMKFVKEKLGL
jgi:hypothetical protein